MLAGLLRCSHQTLDMIGCAATSESCFVGASARSTRVLHKLKATWVRQWGNSVPQEVGERGRQLLSGRTSSPQQSRSMRTAISHCVAAWQRGGCCQWRLLLMVISPERSPDCSLICDLKVGVT